MPGMMAPRFFCVRCRHGNHLRDRRVHRGLAHPLPTQRGPTSGKTYCLEPVARCAWWLPPSKKLPQLRTSKPDAVSVILK